MKNRIIKIILILTVTLTIAILASMNLNISNAITQTTADKIQELTTELEDYAETIDPNKITKEDVLKIYDIVNEKLTNEEIANIIEENKEELKQEGITEEAISAGTTLLNTTDREKLRNIIENDINFDNINEKIDEGYTPNEIVESIVTETPTIEKVNFLAKILFANTIIKDTILASFAIWIYAIVVRWVIYKKAGKHGWAAIIPIYNEITNLKVCGLSPWFLLFWFLPIIGWTVLFVVKIVQRFQLAYKFGKGTLFGFGNLILPIIFNSIIAFDTNTKYVE